MGLLLALLLAQTTPNMGLSIPSGAPTYFNEDMLILDAHTHAASSGVRITPSGLGINALLPFNGWAPTAMGYAGFDDGGAGPSVPLTLWSNGIDLCYEDGLGNIICLTSGGQVNVPALDGGLYVNGNQGVDGGISILKLGSCFTTGYGVIYCDNAAGDAVITPITGSNTRLLGGGLVLGGDGGIFQSGTNMIIAPTDGGYPIVEDTGGGVAALQVNYGGFPVGLLSSTGKLTVGVSTGPGDASVQLIPDTSGSGNVIITPFGVTEGTVNLHLSAAGTAQVVATSELVADAGLLIGPYYGTPTAIQSHHWALLYMNVGGLPIGTTTDYAWGPPPTCGAPYPNPPCVCGTATNYANYTCPDGGSLGSMSGVSPWDSCYVSTSMVFNDGGISGGGAQVLLSPAAIVASVSTGLPNQGPVQVLFTNESGTLTDGGLTAIVSISCDRH